MYTYYSSNKTCLLYDTFELPPRTCSNPSHCQSGKISNLFKFKFKKKKRFFNSFLWSLVSQTTTESTTAITSTFAPLNFPILNKLDMGSDTCLYENEISYNSAIYLIEYFNSNLDECCQICMINQYCLSWTLFPVVNSNFTCRLYDSLRPSPLKEIGHQSGFNLKVAGKNVFIIFYLFCLVFSSYFVRY